MNYNTIDSVTLTQLQEEQMGRVLFLTFEEQIKELCRSKNITYISNTFDTAPLGVYCISENKMVEEFKDDLANNPDHVCLEARSVKIDVRNFISELSRHFDTNALKAFGVYKVLKTGLTIIPNVESTVMDSLTFQPIPKTFTVQEADNFNCGFVMRFFSYK